MTTSVALSRRASETWVPVAVANLGTRVAGSGTKIGTTPEPPRPLRCVALATQDDLDDQTQKVQQSRAESLLLTTARV